MKTRARLAVTAAVTVLLSMSTVQTSVAQTYPSKPVRLVLPYPPGGGSDIIARPLAQLMTAGLGQQVVIENRGGAGGNLGMELVARSAPDGYTLIWGITAQLAVNPALYPKMNFDLIKDFTPICLMGQAPYVFVIHPSLPVKNVSEFVALVKPKPGVMSYSSAGNGSGAHLSAEMLNWMAGLKTVHVPYKGAGPAMPDLIAGQVQFSFITYTASSQFVKAGRLRAIGVTTPKRSAALPDVPAIAESVPGYDSGVWYGLLAPTGTPPDIIRRLNTEIVAALKQPDLRQRLLAEAFEPIGSTPEQLGEYMKSEIARWAKVVKATGAKID